MDPATLALVAEIERVLRPHADSMGALPSKTARDLMVGADDVPNALEGIVGVVEVSGRVQIGEIVAFIRRQCSGPSEELAMKSESRLDPMICRAYEVARASKDSGASLAGPLIEPEGVTERTYEFTSTPDGNVVKILFVRRRDAADVLLSPCVVYFHGGGMASGSAYDPQHRNWARCLAFHGAVSVAMVDFRNSCNSSRANPQEVKAYPGGLDDCCSGLEWVHRNATSLGVDAEKVMLAGESGGANLALATALRCKREGNLALFACWYVVAPMIAGTYPRPHCDSIHEFAGLPPGAHTPRGDARAVSGYCGPDRFDDPLCWPYCAAEADVEGLPRGAVLVNELDPLKDEGMHFFRTCLSAGVDVTGRVLLGTTHCANVLPGVLPQASADTARAMRALLLRSQLHGP